MTDADRLRSWRNDPLTVANFRLNREVTAAEHLAWMQKQVEGPEIHHVYICEEPEDVPIGTVQLMHIESKPGSYETSVTVAPEARGKGYGGKMLKTVCDCYPVATLYTEVKYDNKASMKSFGAAGFEQIGSYGLWTQWRRLPIRQ
jgi:L-amino acid N-acyltransferase YncA